MEDYILKGRKSPVKIKAEKMKPLMPEVHFNMFFAIIATLALSALTAITFFQSVTMQESAMEPTFYIGDRFFMNRLVYKVSEPKRGDIIVYKTNGSDDAALHIHRVIAVPGETVQILKGRVLINGSTLRESGDYPSISNAGIASAAITLEDDQYFVLGDNRNNSDDSRFGDVGLVSRNYIVGKLWYRAGPFNRAGFLR